MEVNTRIYFHEKSVNQMLVRFKASEDVLYFNTQVNTHSNMINGATPTHLDDGLERRDFICHNKLTN